MVGSRPRIAADHRREAVYALSRKRDKTDDPVPQLIEIAQGSKHRDARAAAMYSLGQLADARAIDLFTSMLRGK